MTHRVHLKRTFAAVVTVTLSLTMGASRAQGPAPPNPVLGDGPWVINSNAQRFKVVAIKGLRYPWALTFLPDGNILVTERGQNTLRIVRNGVVDPKPITGLPLGIKDAGSRAGLDIALHPRYAENKLIYFTYWKPKLGEEDVGTAVLARARYDGGYTVTAVKDLFVADSWVDGPAAARIVFGRDGKIYMVIGSPGFSKRVGNASSGQNPGEHGGKVLRLNDDGTVPQDNPFVGRPGYKPEIYALGIRNSDGLILHPETGELWETEHGPQGGDEVNIIKRGANYGWPFVTYGRAYNYDLDGARSGLVPPTIQPLTSAPGMEEPFLFYIPSIAISGIAFYTGDQLSGWKGNLFVGGLRGTQLSRISLNKQGLESRRETLLMDLRQRIRDVRQGPDGFLYLTTDEKDGAILRIEPAPADTSK